MRDQTAGILLMIAVMAGCATMDGISRHLAQAYNVVMVVTIRYWFFAGFVVLLAARRAGGIGAAAATVQPGLQIFRGVLLAAEVLIMVLAFVMIGLVEAHAVFAVTPLLIAALSGPVLGEHVGWRRWVAIGAGFVGILVILQPGMRVFDPGAFVALAAALCFALYGLLTRAASRRDGAATSFFWTGVAGAAVLTPFGIWFWEPMAVGDWGWMAALCVLSSSAHFGLIKVYELVEASSVQPFAYLQLVFASAIGVAAFAEALRPATLAGAAIVVGAGLFTLWRSAAVSR